MRGAVQLADSGLSTGSHSGIDVFFLRLKSDKCARMQRMDDQIRTLIAQACRDNPDLHHGDVAVYAQKLLDLAEFIICADRGAIQGFIAFYCNDLNSKMAFISFVLVTPEARGQGLARSLVQFVLSRAKSRGFTRCRLEVATKNEAAFALYRQMGFSPLEERAGKYLMEAEL